MTTVQHHDLHTTIFFRVVARMRQDQEFKSEQQAKITSAVEYLSVTGSLIFKDGRYVNVYDGTV